MYLQVLLSTRMMHVQVCTLDRCCEHQRTHFLHSPYRMCICDICRYIYIYMYIGICIYIYVYVHVCAYVYVYVAGEAAMRKSIPALRQAKYESISYLPRIQQSYREKALVVIPLAMRMSATSNSEQRVQVLIPVVQGLSQKQR